MEDLFEMAQKRLAARDLILKDGWFNVEDEDGLSFAIFGDKNKTKSALAIVDVRAKTLRIFDGIFSYISKDSIRKMPPGGASHPKPREMY